MFAFKAVTFLLPVVGVFGNYFNLSELIERIHKESDLAKVYFIDIHGEFLDDFMAKHSTIAVVIFKSTREYNNDILYENSAVLVVQTHTDVYRHFEMLHKFVLQLRLRKFVIIYSTTVEDLFKYFSYFSENKFTRIFGLSGNISFAYLPYAENSIQLLHKGQPLPDAMRDLNGFSFRTTVERDIPRTFWYPDKHGRAQVGGCFGQIFVNFLRRHNATFEEILINNSTVLQVPEVVNATINNEIDISMNVYVQPTGGLDFSYPVKLITWPIMVPINGYVDPEEYFLRPFSPGTWLCIGLTLLYIFLMDAVKDICINCHVDLWHTFSRTFLAMLKSPSERQITSAYRFHAQVLVLAFVLGNMYVIYFTSYLTVFIRVRQYETIQDLIDNNVRVLIPNHEWELIEDPELHLAGFENIVTLVDYPTYITEMNSMRNTNFGHGVGLDRGEFLIGLQKVFSKPLFRLTSDSLGDYYIGYLMVTHSPFKEILDNFIIHAKDTGLIEKWNQDTIGQAQRAGFRLDVDREASWHRQNAPLTFDNLRFAWNCLTAGLTLSGLVFVIEKYGGTVKKCVGFFKHIVLRR